MKKSKVHQNPFQFFIANQNWLCYQLIQFWRDICKIALKVQRATDVGEYYFQKSPLNWMDSNGIYIRGGHYIMDFNGWFLKDWRFNCNNEIHFIKHEYLWSRAYKCLSLSSSSSWFPVTVIRLWTLSRYSCLFLDLASRNFLSDQSPVPSTCKLWLYKIYTLKFLQKVT